MQLAPWLNPPNYLAAMQAGAGIGLHQREQDFAEQHAADALRESYAHLAATQDIAQKGLQAAAARQQAALALRASQNDALNLYRQQRISQADQRLQPEPMFHFGTNGSVLKLDPSSGTVQTLKEGESPIDPEQKDYERQLRTAQAALDVAKRNNIKISSTHPVTTSHWFGRPDTTEQVPNYQEDDINKSKAALSAAQELLDEKQSLLQSYKASRGKTSGSSVTHRYNPATGDLESVSQNQGE